MTLLVLYNVIFAVALASTAYAFVLASGDFSILVFFQGAVILLSFMMSLTPHFGRLRTNNLLIWILLSFFLLFNLFIHIVAGSYSNTLVTAEFAMFHVFGIVGLLFSLQWVAVNLSPENIMRYTTFTLLPLMVLAITVAISKGELGFRATPFDIHPNWWGELGFASTITALALHGKVRMLSIGVALVLFVLVQSRGALLASVVCVGSHMFLTVRVQYTRGLLLAGMTLALVLILVLVFSMQWQSTYLWLLMRDYVLLWDNPYRGVDSGLTGRLESWSLAFDAIEDNPLLGRGFDTLNYVHNGFLQVAAEGGLPLFTALVSIMAIAAWGALKKSEYLRLSVILGYIVYTMTYPRMLNMNLASIFFYLCLFSWSDQSNRRGLARVGH